MNFMNRRPQFAFLALLIPIVIAVFAVARVLNFGGDAPLRLKVDLSERRLYVMEGGEVVQTYAVAVGQPSHPTPTGSYRTGRIVWNPGWTPPPRPWARGMEAREPGDPRNPMVGVKIYFREPWYYIHGTNDPGSIGTAASRGCLRMNPGEAKALARRIEGAGGSVPLEIVP